MKNRKVIIVVSILSIFVVAVVLMMLLASLRKERPKVPPKEIKRYVKTEKVIYGDIESQVTGRGRLSSKQLVDAVSEVQGRILSGDVPLKKGQSFKKGDLLFVIDKKPFIENVQPLYDEFFEKHPEVDSNLVARIRKEAGL